MRTIKEIQELKSYYENDLYSGVRAAQKLENMYYEDTFPVPELHSSVKIVRSGIGARMVDAPAEQIITSNPQAFFTCKNQDTKSRLDKTVNNTWVDTMRRLNPNPFKEFVKNLCLRGEAYISIMHSEDFLNNRTGMPVLFSTPDSMIIYGSPEEDENGIPQNVIVAYDRYYFNVIQKYPDFSNPKKRKMGDKVAWWAYWDGQSRYFECDGEPVLTDGLQENIYGVTPFVRKYSGFGRRSYDGKLESLIVGDLRYVKDIIREECALSSDISDTFHKYAHPHIDFIVPNNEEINEEQMKSYDMGRGVVNVLPMPQGSTMKQGEVMLPSAEAFNHLYSVRAQLVQRNPFLSAGTAIGASGRQDDIAYSEAMRRYDTIIENTELAFATAFEIGLKICAAVPDLIPETVKEEDVFTEYSCTVRLKAKDPVEEDRLATLGSRLWNGGNGEIDLKTNLIKYQGYTEDEAEEIIARILVDKVTLYSPKVAQLLGEKFAEEMGTLDIIKEAEAKEAAQLEQQRALQSLPAPSSEQRIQGEARPDLGTEMIDMSLGNKGARRPPARFTRNGAR